MRKLVGRTILAISLMLSLITFGLTVVSFVVQTTSLYGLELPLTWGRYQLLKDLGEQSKLAAGVGPQFDLLRGCGLESKALSEEELAAMNEVPGYVVGSDLGGSCSVFLRARRGLLAIAYHEPLAVPREPDHITISLAGFRLERYDVVVATDDRKHGESIARARIHSARVSLWLALGVFALYPLIAVVRGPCRRYVRMRRGACTQCGYDLTGNVSGRCPECGLPREKPAESRTWGHRPDD
jgi:hypothetical protein